LQPNLYYRGWVHRRLVKNLPVSSSWPLNYTLNKFL